MLRKMVLAASLLAALSAPALADAPGVTPTEIKVGATFPFSGPASALGAVGKALIAYVNLINDNGGVNGRKINLIALDDAYSPPKTVEQTRKLVGSDEVAFIFSPLGTASNLAVAKYLAAKKDSAGLHRDGCDTLHELRRIPVHHYRIAEL